MFYAISGQFFEIWDISLVTMETVFLGVNKKVLDELKICPLVA